MYRITHMLTGTAFEFDARGNSLLHVEGDSYHSTTGNIENHATGNLTETAGGYACTVWALMRVCSV